MPFPVIFRQCLALGLTALVAVAGGCYRPGMLRTRVPEVPPFTETGEAQVPKRWWQAFEDPVLNAQINGAFASNYTLAAALQRVYAARALARREASDLLPDLDGVVAGQSLFGPGRDRTFVELGFATDYQLDLWGEIESRVDAERFRADATGFDYKALALTLSADIAGTWFSLIEAHAQVELLEEQIETNRTGLQLQEARFGLGLIRSADVLRQRQLLESTLEQAVVAGRRIELLEHQ
ncbi:MAG: TolC family protein, partial [Planctomycetota bacterium]